MADLLRHMWTTGLWPSQHIVRSSIGDDETDEVSVRTFCGLRRRLSANRFDFQGSPNPERKTCESCFRYRELAA